ncbi:EF-hand domain-containing protein [Rhizobium sp. RAF56]|uniref:EF-hand domain-containing protein n=1 Tax=Rhizobium sp. RAF56 TaxID=3233062 RepID=UPI003F9B98B7
MSLPKLPTIAALAIYSALGALDTASAQMMSPDAGMQYDQAQPQGGISPMPPGMHGVIGRPMMGHDMMRGDIMDQGMMSYGMMAEMPMGPMHGRMMKIMFAIADTNSDGALSFEEVSAIHKRIFDVIDANKDGKVTPDELLAFMTGQ